MERKLLGKGYGSCAADGAICPYFVAGADFHMDHMGRCRKTGAEICISNPPAEPPCGKVITVFFGDEPPATCELVAKGLCSPPV